MVLFESFNFPEFLLVIAFMIFNPTTIMQLAIFYFGKLIEIIIIIDDCMRAAAMCSFNVIFYKSKATSKSYLFYKFN